MTARPWTALLVSGTLWLAVLPAQAQMPMSGGSRSLGGYGSATISSYYGGGGGGYMPYAGGGQGFVPYRSGSSGGLGIDPLPRRIPETTIGGTTMMAATPIGGASLSGGMGSGSMGLRGGSYFPFGYEGGVGMSGGMLARPMSRTDRTRSGPGFGYPFRMPPSLAGSSTMTTP